MKAKVCWGPTAKHICAGRLVKQHFMKSQPRWEMLLMVLWRGSQGEEKNKKNLEGNKEKWLQWQQRGNRSRWLDIMHGMKCVVLREEKQTEQGISRLRLVLQRSKVRGKVSEDAGEHQPQTWPLTTKLSPQTWTTATSALRREEGILCILSLELT